MPGTQLVPMFQAGTRKDKADSERPDEHCFRLKDLCFYAWAVRQIDEIAEKREERGRAIKPAPSSA